MGHTHDMAINAKGQSLALTSVEIRSIVERAISDGELLAVVLEMPNGEVVVPVLGDPSLKLVEALEMAAVAYRRMLDGQ